MDDYTPAEQAAYAKARGDIDHLIGKLLAGDLPGCEDVFTVTFTRDIDGELWVHIESDEPRSGESTGLRVTDGGWVHALTELSVMRAHEAPDDDSANGYITVLAPGGAR